MRTVRTKVYKFSELNETAQQKAIQKNCDINVSEDWWEWTYYDAKQVGIIISSFDIDRGSYCEIGFKESAEATAHLIIDNHGETCETYKTAENYLKQRDELINTAPKDENGDFEDESQIDSDLDDLDKDFENSISEDYRTLLKNEYEYLTSEEAIKETIIANEYEFTVDGKQF